MRMTLASTLLLAVAALTASSDARKTCGVLDWKGTWLERTPHPAGTFRADSTPEVPFPGFLRMDHVRVVRVKSGTCNADGVRIESEGDRIRVVPTERFDFDREECTFALEVEKEDGCPETTPSEVTLRFVRRDGDPTFDRDGYLFQATFPIPAGTAIADVWLSGAGDDSAGVDISDAFDGVEVIRTGPGNAFRVQTTRLLYLIRDASLLLVAAGPDGPTSTARIDLRMTRESALPGPEFEDSCYDATVQTSRIRVGEVIFPPGTVTLREDYPKLDLEVRSINVEGLKLKATREEGSRDVRILVERVPEGNATSRDGFFHVIATLMDAMGRRTEGSTSLYVRFLTEGDGSSSCPAIYEPDNSDHLQIAVIVLSVVVVLLLLVIIYLYFKYVSVRKTEVATPVCKKCSIPPVKTRRPTPRKISEYPYPLDMMSKPLETLEESEAEEDDIEVKVVKAKEEPGTGQQPGGAASQSRKASDEGPRQGREGLAVGGTAEVAERKISRESQRKVSTEEEERRRRKSSVKMYRCMT